MSANGFLDLGPRKSNIDFSYLEGYDRHHIPTCFDKCNFSEGQSLEARITQIYDPSKFWMVSKYQELEVFQKYLFKFYYMNRAHYKIPRHQMKVDLYCVAFIDNAYYRGVIAGFVDNYQGDQEVQVYFIDYGMIGMASVDHIFYISEKCIKVPQFAIKAALAGVCPLTSRTWTVDGVVKFSELVRDKILIAVVVNIDFKRQILEVHIREKNTSNLVPIHEVLISQRHARYFEDKEEISEDKRQYETTVEYPYLFPSHEALSTGKVPGSVWDANFQVQLAPMWALADNLIHYYQRKRTDNNETH